MYAQVRIMDDLRLQQQQAVRSGQTVGATMLSHVPLTSAPPPWRGQRAWEAALELWQSNRVESQHQATRPPRPPLLKPQLPSTSEDPTVLFSP